MTGLSFFPRRPNKMTLQTKFFLSIRHIISSLGTLQTRIAFPHRSQAPKEVSCEDIFMRQQVRTNKKTFQAD